MVEREEEQQAEDGGILSRWSRRKQSASGPVVDDAQEIAAADPEILPDELNSEAMPAVAGAEPAAEDAEENAEPLLTDEDMPDIETISKDSDVSCFFNRGVSEQLRQRALRHLLRLPAFNITDGLNDYDEDYTVFEPLGDIVTSDMRFHARRKEKLAAQKLEEEEALAAKEADEAETDEAMAEQQASATEDGDESVDPAEQAAEAGDSELDDEAEVGATAGHTANELATENTADALQLETDLINRNNPGDSA